MSRIFFPTRKFDLEVSVFIQGVKQLESKLRWQTACLTCRKPQVQSQVRRICRVYRQVAIRGPEVQSHLQLPNNCLHSHKQLGVKTQDVFSIS